MILGSIGKLALAAAIGLSVTSLQAGTLRLGESLGAPPVAVHLPPAVTDDLAFFAQMATNSDDLTLTGSSVLSLSPDMLAERYSIAAGPGATAGEVNFSPFGMMVATATPTVVPEPSTFVLLGMGAVGIYAAARRRRRKPARA